MNRQILAVGLGLLVVGSVITVGVTAGASAAKHPSAQALGSDTPDRETTLLAGEPVAQVTGCNREAGLFVSLFNEQIGRVPGFVRNRIRNSNVHLLIHGDQGGDYTMETNGTSQVVAYREGMPESPSLRIVTDCETFRNITDAQDPRDAFQRAYNNDEIIFIGVGAINWLLFTGLDIATDPVSLVIFLIVLLLLIVLLYVLYRRFSHYYRGGEQIEPGDQEE